MGAADVGSHVVVKVRHLLKGPAVPGREVEGDGGKMGE